MAIKTIDFIEEDYGTFDAAGFAAETFSSQENLAAVLDHTLLKPDATQQQVLQLCKEAAENRFACAMVNPTWASLSVQELRGTGISVGSVIGFPLGASLTSTKRQEAQALVTLGVHDLDMVINVGQLKSGDLAAVERDIRTVAEAVHDNGAILKVILETCLLSIEEKLRASDIAINAGTDFLKTSTGLSTAGATVTDVAILRGVAGARCGVKAAGGIRTLADARTMLEAGANRIGTSAGIKILTEMTG